MFVNLETTVLQELLTAGAGRKWNLVAIAFMRSHDREVALAKLAQTIHRYVLDQAANTDQVTADFYQHALTRADCLSIAQALIQAAESAERPRAATGDEARAAA